jgi:hypothetical protein
MRERSTKLRQTQSPKPGRRRGKAAHHSGTTHHRVPSQRRSSLEEAWRPSPRTSGAHHPDRHALVAQLLWPKGGQ